MPRYFSVNPPALVTRFGTGTYLGAAVSMVNGVVAIDWNPLLIVEISDRECINYLREYSSLVRDGSLREHTQAEYREYVETEEIRAAIAEDELLAAITAVQAPESGDPQPPPESDPTT